MDDTTRQADTSATELLKFAAVAVALAIVVSSAKTTIAPLLAERPLDRTAQEQQATQLAHRHAASYEAPPEPEQQDPL
jgi:hypothetical protein